jgi:Ca2+/Na+ antiporter
MTRALLLLATVSLVGMLVYVGMVIDLSLHGAYFTGYVERFPGAAIVAIVGSAISQLGLLVLVAATILGSVHAGQHRQWLWFVLILVLCPVAVAALFVAGFAPDIRVGMLTLLSPLALLIYSLRTQSARSQRGNPPRHGDTPSPPNA